MKRFNLSPYPEITGLLTGTSTSLQRSRWYSFVIGIGMLTYWGFGSLGSFDDIFLSKIFTVFSDVEASGSTLEAPAGIGAVETYSDEFSTLTYSGSDGTIDWSSSPWYEVGDGSGDIFTGAVAVRNSSNAFGGTGNTLKTSLGHGNSAPGVYVYRELDLSTASSATLSFYLRHDLSGADDISLEISNNGGASWTVLKNYTASDPDPSNESFDITTYISSNTQIRFYLNTIGGGGSIWTDNVQVEYAEGEGYDNSACNWINNDEFDNGTSDWILHNECGSCSSTFSINSGAELSGPNSAFIDISTVDGNNWGIEFRSEPHSIENGKQYAIRFDAKAVANRNITVVIMERQSPWTWYHTIEVPITTTATQYGPFYWTSNVSQANAGLVFLLGETTDNVYLDDIVFGEVGCFTATSCTDNYATAVTSEISVTNSGNALGSPDGNTADLEADVGELILDFGEVIAEGNDVNLYLKYHVNSGGSVPVLDVDASLNAAGPFTDLVTYDALTTTVANYTYNINQAEGLRYLRLRARSLAGNASNQFVDVDAIEFEYCFSGDNNTISGSVYNDVNSNGIMESADWGEEGVTVRLYVDANENGILDGPDLLVESMDTDAEGNYSFSIPRPSSNNTYSQRVIAFDDDSKSSSNGNNVNNAETETKLDSEINGVRFQGVSIPAGSVVTSAYLSFTSSTIQNINPSAVKIYAEDSANPPAFVNVDYDITSRTSTANTVNWDLGSWTTNNEYTSPDISAIVQELVDDNLGLINAPVVFILEDVHSNERNAFTYDSDPSKAPLLVIEYTQPSISTDYYITTVLESTLPAGYTWTTDNVETAIFSVGGITNSNNNFGFYNNSLNYISGNAFKDMNSNALNDAPDEGQSGVTINLYDDMNEDGLVDGGDTLVSTTTSDGTGTYLFALNNDYSTSGSYSQRVAASEDDAKADANGNNGFIDETSIRIANKNIGVRFRDINIPAGATVSSAYLQFTADGDNNQNISSVNIFAEDSANPPVFVASGGDLASRTRTTANMSWIIGDWSDNSTYNSPDLSTIVQELVNDNGGLTNAPMVFLLDIVENKRRDAHAWDGDPSKAPLLVINWTRPAPDFHYVIETDVNTLPPGSTLTTDNIETAYFTAAGQTDNSNDFGLEPDHLISGTVYEDLNASGFYDAGDNGQDNVTVYLYHDLNQDGMLDGGDALVDSIDTYTDGAFYFAPSLNTSTQDSSQVNSISDDAEESLSSGAIDVLSSDLELVDEGGSNLQIVGMRFTNLGIPQGATITNAYIEFEVDELDSGTANLTFSGQDIDDAPAFTTTDYDISSRTKTSSTVTWTNVAPWDTESEKKQTPSIATVVQEIVNRSGWASGNDLVILVEGDGERTAEAFEGEPANAPKLVVSWSEGTLPAYYVMTLDESDLPVNSYLVTDNLETAAFTTSGQSDAGNDFGFVVNTTPIANDDTESTPEDSPLISSVLSNDTDAENNIDPGSVLITISATNGTLSIDPLTGVVTYTPNTDYFGPDQYTYSVCDSFNLCDTALVSITVTPVNDDPVATDNSFTVSYNTANQALDVLDAGVPDSDPEGNTIQITGAGTDAINGVTTQGGTVSLNLNGTPGDYTDDFVEYTPANGFVGTDTFLYAISDGLGGTDTGTVTLTVFSTTEIDCGNGFDDDGDGMVDCDDPDCTPIRPTGISRY